MVRRGKHKSHRRGRLRGRSAPDLKGLRKRGDGTFAFAGARSQEPGARSRTLSSHALQVGRLGGALLCEPVADWPAWRTGSMFMQKSKERNPDVVVRFQPCPTHAAWKRCDYQMNKRPITIASVQSYISADVRENGQEIRRLMQHARAEGAAIAHFPEGAMSGYTKSQIKSWDHVDWDARNGRLRFSTPSRGEQRRATGPSIARGLSATLAATTSPCSETSSTSVRAGRRALTPGLTLGDDS